MNIFLWVLQALLALHTAIGAVWKFSNSAEKTMPSLKAIPNGIWLGMGVFELLLSLCLILPAFYQPLAILVPIAAACVAAEMLFFCVLHVRSSHVEPGPVIYWMVVAVISAFISFGRFVLNPH